MVDIHPMLATNWPKVIEYMDRGLNFNVKAGRDHVANLEGFKKELADSWKRWYKGNKPMPNVILFQAKDGPTHKDYPKYEGIIRIQTEMSNKVAKSLLKEG